MARWKLTEPHYLNVPGTEWEQVTTDRVTQRPVRKKYPVPRHLDPRVVDDWTHDSDGDRPFRQGDMDGSIVVAWADAAHDPRDIIFVGDPSPGMLPLDDEARAASAKFSWTPTQRIDDGFGEQPASVQASILNSLIKELADATVKGSGPVPHGFDKFMEAMAVMMQQQTQILAQILGKQQEIEFTTQARAAGAEPPVEAEPLDEPDPPTAEELRESAIKAEAADHASRLKAQAYAERRRV